MEIVRARAEQAPLLSGIAWRAKAGWRYPSRWMENWRETLNIQPAQIEANHYFVAMESEQIIGFCGIHVAEPGWQLEHLWVLPAFWKGGTGRRLFFHAVDFATKYRVREIIIESDPNAEGFYLRMGAKRVGTLETEVEGTTRTLPKLSYTIHA